MHYSKLILSVTALASLSACGGGFKPLLGPDATLAEAATKFDSLETRVTDISIAEGDTLEVDLPSGSATYRGIVSGGDGTGGAGSVDHYADLKLITDFDTTDVTGSVYNVVTDEVDFENPTGTADVTGSISNDGGVATISFSAFGVLVGDNGVEAEYDMFSANGTFVGDTGAAIDGSQLTDIDWIAGPNAGNSAISDGAWYAERK